MTVQRVTKCGHCPYGKIIPQDVTKRMCHGAPPSAFQIPAQGGRMSLQMTRPIVGATDEACALIRCVQMLETLGMHILGPVSDEPDQVTAQVTVQEPVKQ